MPAQAKIMLPRYAVIGNPVAHSLSPLIHQAFARDCSINLQYERLLAPVDGFADAVQTFIALDGRGLNVTVPFKTEAWALAGTLSDRARLAGAVNTLSFTDQGIAGDNTDGAGLVRDIEHNLHYPLRGKRILLIGAGGAARGVLLPLLQTVPAALTIVNRTIAKAEQLAALTGGDDILFSADFAALTGQTFDVLINATSASLHGELPPLSTSVVTQDTLVYDMMYGREPTPFLRWAQAAGAARLADGLGMLVEQAAESFNIWHAVRPQTTQVLADLRATMR